MIRSRELIEKGYWDMNSTDYTVFIIDDNPVVCHALRSLFESVDFNVKTYHDAHVFLDNQEYKKAGCLIADVRMPFMSGLQLLERLKILKSNLPVIMITGHGDVQMAVRAMKLGAVDFILKPFNDQLLLELVQSYIQKEVKTRELSELDMMEGMSNMLHQLSEREKQVLDLIAEGNLNKEIAHTLFISVSTVEVHRASIMRKLHVKSLAQLLRMYIKYQVHLESLMEIN